ncbi:ribbon-helix-helix domain-containing protein [Limobrevibacterium gyesilva]|uniref:Antitoxin-like ribbon-helix-helix domain-containing protein n=1 Tax=Limobrevibacterium gyesilva TaxID=2991712 RepID=A0AA41YVX8_9PROT|nr:ribbon-helix-helix domain-containing protein [Limobrevibacterium gyesilva]MCW3477385.1 hypothetical protein [Limobrevibacterium gyesilva]
MTIRPRPTLTMPPATRAAEPPAAAPEAAPARPAKPPARAGKVQLAGYIDRDAKRQLDIFAAREGRTMQDIVEEMVDLFAHQHQLTRLVRE